MRSKIFNLRRLRDAPTRIFLIWTVVVALLFGLADFGAPLENLSKAVRNKARAHDASGQVVVVGIDTLAISENGNWPWSFDQYARLIDHIDKAGAKTILFDFKTVHAKTDANQRRFARSLQQSRADIYLNANFVFDSSTGIKTDLIPSADLRKHAKLVNTNLWIDGYNAVWDAPYEMRVGDEIVPSVASVISGLEGDVGETFPIDYSTNLYSIPYVSAADVLVDAESLSSLKGKNVIIGLNEPSIGQRFSIIGHGPAAGTFVSALSAETLLAGRPTQLGWLSPFLVIFFLLAVMIYTSRRSIRVAALSTAILLPVFAPIALESFHIFSTVMPALFLTIFVACHYAWARHRQSFQQRGMFNEISGLPNLNALRQDGAETRDGLIACRIHNYAQVATALPTSLEKALVDQISMRLTLGNGARKIYHGDEGIFLWLVPEETVVNVGDQLSALHAIFRSPANVAGRNIDLTISFGVDADPGRSIQNRISSALLAMQEAADNGTKWQVYDPSRLEATEWKVSLLGELDAALDSGEVWVAFQPKLNLRTGEICGAEALVRWSHPEKGLINPEEFIIAAEKHDRIEKLTEHVLNKAVAAAAIVNQTRPNFDIAVNLSPKLIGLESLRPMVRDALRNYGLPAERLILEITETAAMSSATDAMEELKALRAMGLQLSIDDYGTGFSTLDYLKRCPSSEIKIDRSFISVLDSSRSDRIMVNSTIELAHSLGELVVAEGVEDGETLQLLTQMGCDKAQGFLIARPMPFEALMEFLAERKKSEAA